MTRDGILLNNALSDFAIPGENNQDQRTANLVRNICLADILIVIYLDYAEEQLSSPYIAFVS
jgi:hypothetical protein